MMNGSADCRLTIEMENKGEPQRTCIVTLARRQSVILIHAELIHSGRGLVLQIFLVSVRNV
jgi:hypothetical protein